MSHSPTSIDDVKYFNPTGPPNSPPTLLLRLIIRMMTTITASEQNNVTEKAKLKGEWRVNKLEEGPTTVNLLSRANQKLVAITGVVNCGDRPGHSDSQEDIHSVAASHISDTGVCVFILDRCHFTGEGICGLGGSVYNLSSEVQSYLENSPGILVPRATNTMAVTESLMPSVQPKWEATSPIIAVTTPIIKMDTQKHKYPPAMSANRGVKIISIK